MAERASRIAREAALGLNSQGKGVAEAWRGVERKGREESEGTTCGRLRHRTAAQPQRRCIARPTGGWWPLFANACAGGTPRCSLIGAAGHARANGRKAWENVAGNGGSGTPWRAAAEICGCPCRPWTVAPEGVSFERVCVAAERTQPATMRQRTDGRERNACSDTIWRAVYYQP